MNESNPNADQNAPAMGRSGTWWAVRPVLRVILLAELLVAAVFIALNSVGITIVRNWLKFEIPKLQSLQILLVALALLSVVAVLIEAVRTGRLALRRSYS